MKISENMSAFSAFMAEIYSVEQFDFSLVIDLELTEEIVLQMKNFVNSADFLNEMTAIFNRALREIQAEKLQRKGL